MARPSPRLVIHDYLLAHSDCLLSSCEDVPGVSDGTSSSYPGNPGAANPRFPLPHTGARQTRPAAARVFPRQGLHGSSLDQVAREAGITKGTIYLYYRSKEDLFLATLREKST